MNSAPKDPSRFLPHRPPMLLIDEMLSVSDTEAVGRTCIKADNPFLRSDGRLERVVYPELMAQCSGALEAYRAWQEDRTSPATPGYLAQLKNITFLHDSFLHALLIIKVRLVTRLDPIVACSGQVFRQESCNQILLAEGAFKLCLPRAQKNLERSS